MKKWIYFLLILTIAFFIFQQAAFLSKSKGEQGPFVNYYTRNDLTPVIGETMSLSEDMIYQGNLLLVNQTYPVREEGIKPDLINLREQKHLVEGYGLLQNDIQLSEEVAKEFLNMVQAAAEDGIHNFIISSGYRDFDKQNDLFQELGEDVALPAGFSEHHLGLSLDIGSSEMTMDKAPEGKWIEENSWRFGFILRYPQDKTAITGIQHEPWHIRYVGLPHSAIIYQKNFALEEYIQYIKKEEEIALSIDDRSYIVTYYPLKQHSRIDLPASQNYKISGNNIDGVIVTFFEDNWFTR